MNTRNLLAIMIHYDVLASFLKFGNVIVLNWGLNESSLNNKSLSLACAPEGIDQPKRFWQ